MKKLYAFSVRRLLAMGLLGTCSSAWAIPTLQLDIGGGTYVGGTEESTVANADSFDLYALLHPNTTSTLSGYYRISAALYPKTALTIPAPMLGTFELDGETYKVTEDMVWGTPPVDLLDDTTAIGTTLPTHGTFPTYFAEFEFLAFNSSSQSAPYNVAEGAGVLGDPTSFPGSGLYYQQIAVNVSGLADGYGIHFDLYQVGEVAHATTATTTTGTGKNKKVTKVTTTTYTTDMIAFAPFSHDAESGDKRFQVPDGGTTLVLVGLGILGLGCCRAMGRRKA